MSQQPIFDQKQGGFRVFVGNLGSRTNVADLQHECERYGPLVDCWVARNPPGFAFVLYKDGEDANSAVRNMDGRMICGQRVRVEHAKARSENTRNAPSHGGYRERERSHRRSRSRSNSRDRSKKKSSRRRHRSRESTPRRKHKSPSSDSDGSSSDREKKRSRRRRTKSKDEDASNHSKDNSHDGDDQKKETTGDKNESEHSNNESSDQN